MGLSLQYGNYTFERMPAVAPTISYKPAEDGSKSIREESWVIEGALTGNTTELQAKWDELVGALQEVGKDFKLLYNDEVLYEIKASDCIKGPLFTSLQVVDARGGYLATNIRFKAEMQANVKVNSIGDGLISKESSISFTFDIFGYVTITERGVAKSTSNIVSCPAPSYTMHREYWTEESSFEIDASRKSCSYSYTWKEQRLALPPEISDLVSDFSIDVAERGLENFFTSEVRISGRCGLYRLRKKHLDNKSSAVSSNVIIPVSSFTSSDPQIEAVVRYIKEKLFARNVKVLSSEVSVDYAARTISFNFTIQKATEGKLLKFDYAVSMKSPTTDLGIVYRYGTTPIIRRLSRKESEITEEGEVVFFGERPPTPKPFPGLELYATTNSVSCRMPVYDRMGKIAQAGVSFSFSYILSTSSWSAVKEICAYRFGEFGTKRSFWS